MKDKKQHSTSTPADLKSAGTEQHPQNKSKVTIPSLFWRGGKGVRLLLLVVLLVFLLRTFAFTPYLIPSSGMENSLFHGEGILVNKWSYGLRVPMQSLFSYHRWCEAPVEKEDIVVFNNPAAIQQPVIDKREIYISRCVGIPGDTLMVDSVFNIVAPDSKYSPDHKRLYTYPQEKEQQMDSLISILAIPHNKLMGQSENRNVRNFSRYEFYLLEQAMNGKCWIEPLHKPQGEDVHPLVVPGKGRAVRVYPWNITLLRNTLVMHEGKHAEIQNDTLYIDGRPTQHCYFTKDYYWMASNNSVNLSDSRLFGFVPKDHVIGKAAVVWYSKEDHTGLFEGYRWKRFFKEIK